MAETQRLSAWGWFVRAFAGGIGAMFGVMTALVFACVICYVMFAAGVMALSSFGSVNFEQPMAVTPSDYAPVIGSTPVGQPQELPQVYANPYAIAPESTSYPTEAPVATPYPVAPTTDAYSTEPSASASFSPSLEPASFSDAPSASNPDEDTATEISTASEYEAE